MSYGKNSSQKPATNISAPSTGSVHPSTHVDLETKDAMNVAAPRKIPINGSISKRPARPLWGVIMNIPRPPSTGVTYM